MQVAKEFLTLKIRTILKCHWLLCETVSFFLEIFIERQQYYKNSAYSASFLEIYSVYHACQHIKVSEKTFGKEDKHCQSHLTPNTFLKDSFRNFHNKSWKT